MSKPDSDEAPAILPLRPHVRRTIGDAALWTPRFPKAFDPAFLPQLRIGPGPYARRDDGVDLVDAAAWVAGDVHGEEPESVCPFLRLFLRGVGKIVGPEDRQFLAAETAEFVGRSAANLLPGAALDLALVRGRAFAVWATCTARTMNMRPTLAVGLSKWCWSQIILGAANTHAAKMHVSGVAAAGVEFVREWIAFRDLVPLPSLSHLVFWLAQLPPTPAHLDLAAFTSDGEGGAA